MQPSNGSFRLPATRALAGSLLLHAAIVVAVWRFAESYDSFDFPEHFVPIELSALPAPPDPPIEAPAEELLEPEPQPPTDTAVETAPSAAATDPQLSTADSSEPEPIEPQPSPETQPAPTDPLPVEVIEELQPPTPVELTRPNRTEIDIAQTQAVERVVAELQAESEYHTFSLDDLADGGDPQALDLNDDGYDVDVFERAAQLKSDGVLPVGRSQSRFVNTVADLCNQLTGGLSVFGLIDVCADPGPRADLFGHLRPQYMESLPMCTQDETLALQVEESAAGAVGSLKCVLVPREVREAYYRRYDPELAYWLPAEADE